MSLDIGGESILFNFLWYTFSVARDFIFGCQGLHIQISFSVVLDFIFGCQGLYFCTSYWAVRDLGARTSFSVVRDFIFACQCLYFQLPRTCCTCSWCQFERLDPEGMGRGGGGEGGGGMELWLFTAVWVFSFTSSTLLCIWWWWLFVNWKYLWAKVFLISGRPGCAIHLLRRPLGVAARLVMYSHWACKQCVFDPDSMATQCF